MELKINNIKTSQKNVDDIKNFLTNEKAAWSWLAAISQGRAQAAAAELYRVVYSKPLANANTQLTQSADSITLETGSWLYISSTSADGIFIEQIRKNHGDIVAFFALCAIAHTEKVQLGQYPNILNLLNETQYTFDKAQGFHLANSKINIAELIKSTKVTHTDELQKEIELAYKNAHNGMATAQASAENELIAFQESINKSKLEIERRAVRRFGAYRRAAKLVKRKATEALGFAKDDLDAAQKAYHDSVALQASVTYWGDRGKKFTTQRRIWLSLVLGSIITTFVVMVLYYNLVNKPESISATAKVVTEPAHKENSEDVKKVAINSTTAKNARETLKPKQSTTNESYIISQIVHFSGAALLVTLMGVLIRLCLRQFNIASHCELDAAERVTMTMTYLALLNENKLKSDEDRRLVLESLFRPNLANSVPETNYVSPVEILVKAIAERGSKP